MIIRIHGARGSHSVFSSAQRIEEIQKTVWQLSQKHSCASWDDFKKHLKGLPHHLHQIYGGATTCLELQSDFAPTPVFFDTGSGFANAATNSNSALCSESLHKDGGECSIFYSHTHWDHIIGLLSAPQIFNPKNHFHVYGGHSQLKERIQTLFDERYFPVPFAAFENNFSFKQLKLGEPLLLGKLQIDHHPQSHPGGSFAYRVQEANKIFVFATDTDLKSAQDPLLETGNNIYSNADVMFIDAHFSPEDFVNKEFYGHAHIEQAIDFGVKENTKIIYLSHQNPFYTDHEIALQLANASTYLKNKYPQSTLQIRIPIEGESISI